MNVRSDDLSRESGHARTPEVYRSELNQPANHDYTAHTPRQMQRERSCSSSFSVRERERERERGSLRHERQRGEQDVASASSSRETLIPSFHPVSLSEKDKECSAPHFASGTRIGRTQADRRCMRVRQQHLCAREEGEREKKRQDRGSEMKL